MELLGSLWLAILASAAAVWVYSAMAWMVMPHHKNDFKKLPDDDKVMDFVRGLNVPPGVYGFPHMGSHSEGQTAEMKSKCEKGPMGLLSVWKMPNMGINMLLTFVVMLIASFLMAYIAVAAGFGRGEPFAKVMQVIGTVGVLTYSVASLPNAIWFQANKSAIVSCLIDGVVMGLIAGAVFGGLWPK